MGDIWYVVYEKHLKTTDLICFVAGFRYERDAKAFKKQKEKDNGIDVKNGYIEYFIEARPLFK